MYITCYVCLARGFVLQTGKGSIVSGAFYTSFYICPKGSYGTQPLNRPGRADVPHPTQHSSGICDMGA